MFREVVGKIEEEIRVTSVSQLEMTRVAYRDNMRSFSLF